MNRQAYLRTICCLRDKHSASAGVETDKHYSFCAMRTHPESGMNIFEMMWLILFVAGAFWGWAFGSAYFGMWGAVLGALVGGGIGLLAAASFILVVALVCKTLFGGTLLPSRKPTSHDSKEEI